MKYYYINGQLVDARQATVGVNDLGLIRGYGIFDYFLVEAGMPLFVDDYIERFLRSADKMHLELDLSRERLKEQVFQLIEANGMREAGIRLVATGGIADDCYTPAHPAFMMMMYKAGGFPSHIYSDGGRLISANYQRDIPDVKTTNYIMGIKMLREVRKAGAVEVLFSDGHFLRETVRANVFIVTKDDRIITPASKILYGVTRKQVLKAAKEHFIIEERDVAVNELKEAKEVFITSSTKRIMPIVQIDDLTIGEGRPGPVTKKVMALYKASVEAYLTISQAER